jgi:hypothetical protein
VLVDAERNPDFSSFVFVAVFVVVYLFIASCSTTWNR